MVPPGGCLLASLVVSAVVSAATSYNNIGTYPPGKEGNTWMHDEVSFRGARGSASRHTFLPHGMGLYSFYR